MAFEIVKGRKHWSAEPRLSPECGSLIRGRES